MSLHDEILQVFEKEVKPSSPNIQLSPADVNRIVTTTVRNFTLKQDMNLFLKKNIEEYCKKYKTKKRGGCGCR